MATKKNITVNGVLTPVWQTDATAQQIDDAVVAAQNAVRYDAAQTLTDAQKTQARGNIAAAPDGYGLGGTAKFLSAADDLNNICVTGWYIWSWNAHPQNAPDNNWGIYGCAMHVFSIAQGESTIQTVYDLSDAGTHGCAIQRTIATSSSGAIYYPWEWVNPPMQLGVEYRTTERYLGKPVYCTLVNFGLLPNKGTKGLNFEEITNPEKIIRWSGSTSNGYALPGGNLYTGWDEIVVRIVANRIDVKTTTDESTYSATFVLWYTKTTD